MPTPFKRKILKIGDSLGITIPKPILKGNDVKKGMSVYMMTDVLDEEGFLVVDLKGRSWKEIYRLLVE